MSTTLSQHKLIIAKIFGLHSHIAELERQIHDLSWDSTFDMWTRNAFIQFCRVMPRGRRAIAFVDLDNVHGLNRLFGYREVDRRVKNTFAIPWRSSDIVARWYSGDEMVILFDDGEEGARRKIGELLGSAQENGLSFAWELGHWDVGKQSVETVIGELSDTLQQNNPETRR